MSDRGHAHRKAAAAFKAQCKARRAPCWLCQQPIDYEAERGDGYAFQLDHVVPVSKAPWLAQDPRNWAPSCAQCNASKGDRPARPGLGTTTRQW